MQAQGIEYHQQRTDRHADRGHPWCEQTGSGQWHRSDVVQNRPGNIIIIDSGSEREEAIALFLAQELKVSGYHRINTEHVFHKVSFREKTLVLSENGRLHETRCRFKVMGELESPVAVDVEHDFLVGLQRELSDGWERYFSLEELRSKVELSYVDGDDEIRVSL